MPYALVSSDGRTAASSPATTSRSSTAAARRTTTNRYPIFGVPEDLIVVDLAAVNPEVRNLRLRGRLEGRRVVPYSVARRDRRARRGLRAQVIAWTADPVELFFLHIQGSGQVALDERRAHPRRLRRPERPSVPLARPLPHRPRRAAARAGFDAGHQGLGGGQSGQAAGGARTPTRATCSSASCRRPPTARSARSACRSRREYSLAVDRRFVPLGAPVYLATTYPLSERARSSA